MKILVINAGSTSVKFALLRDEEELFSTSCEHVSPAEACRNGLAQVRAGGFLFEAVGHRIVHGGPRFTTAVVVDDAVQVELAKLNDLAPLHNPPALAILAEARRQLPDIPHLAAFDTAFHATIPEVAHTYAIPWQWTRDWGLRKYGFHGLSHAYCSSRAALMLGRSQDRTLRVIVAHLGGGCSVAAVEGGVSRDTTMGFTPVDGLIMATRSGSVDPGVLIHVMRHHGLRIDAVEDMLNHQSGLIGVSGQSEDFRNVMAAAEKGDRRAKLAIDMFAYRLQTAIGSMAAALGGMDVLVFTGGIGENAVKLRSGVCAKLEFLGIRIDESLNAASKPDMDIASDGSPCRVLVIHTREALMIAREAKRLLRTHPNDSA